MKKQNLLLIIALVMVAIFARLIPHLPNFTPVGAVAIFSGHYLPKKFAYIIPLAIMLVSDSIVGFYSLQIMAAVYLSFLISVWLGSTISLSRPVGPTLRSTLAGSVIFFLITNAAVWAYSPMYPPTFSGLWESYWSALPFFRNTVLGDLFYVSVLFTGYSLLPKKSLKLNPHPIY